MTRADINREEANGRREEAFKSQIQESDCLIGQLIVLAGFPSLVARSCPGQVPSLIWPVGSQNKTWRRVESND